MKKSKSSIEYAKKLKSFFGYYFLVRNHSYDIILNMIENKDFSAGFKQFGNSTFESKDEAKVEDFCTGSRIEQQEARVEEEKKRIEEQKKRIAAGGSEELEEPEGIEKIPQRYPISQDKISEN